MRGTSDLRSFARPRRLLPFGARGNAALSVANALAGQALLVISGLVVPRILGVENRGHLAFFVLLGIILTQLGGLGLPVASTYWIAGRRRAPHLVVRALAAPALMQVVVLLGVNFLILLAIVRPEGHQVWLSALVALGQIPGLIAQQYGSAILLGLERFPTFCACRLLSLTSYAVATAVIFITGGGTLLIVVSVWTASVLVGGFVSLAVALRAVKAAREDECSHPGRPALRPMLSFGLRGLLGSASPTDTLQLDQAVIGLFLSPTALGLYVVGAAFANFPRIIGISLGFVAYPRAAAQKTRAQARSVALRFCAASVVVCGAFVVLLEVLVRRLVPFLYGHSFAPSARLAQILLVSSLLISTRRVLVEGIRGAGYPALGTMAEVVAWLSLIPSLLVLAPLLGLDGVALSMVAAAATGLVFMAVMVRRLPREEPETVFDSIDAVVPVELSADV